LDKLPTLTLNPLKCKILIQIALRFSLLGELMGCVGEDERFLTNTN